VRMTSLDMFVYACRVPSACCADQLCGHPFNFVAMDQNKERELILREATKDMKVDVTLDFSIIVQRTMGYSNEKLVMLCKEAGLIAGVRIVKQREQMPGKEFTAEELENIHFEQQDFMHAIARFDELGNRLRF
jgi:SpoVK/Ycf46/Vps4 family AAA+-type ATPase